MNIAEKLMEIANNQEGVYDAGYTKGFLSGKESEIIKCKAKHYIEVKKGDGTNTFSVNCGFKPDFFMVFSNSGYLYNVRNRVIRVFQDFRGMGKWSSRRFNTIASGERQPADIKTSVAERFFPYADGRVGYYGEASTSSATKEIVFDENTYYTAICVKYTDKTDAEIITDIITSLPDSGGTLEFAEIKVNGAFTEEEWQTLIATKPNWTFTLV